jgi:hypothetical protein
MFRIQKSTTARYTATLKDELGAVVPGSTLTALTLTVYDVDTSQILNARDAQDALNTNGVSVDEQGNLVWTIAPADTAIITASKSSERHRAVFAFSWGNGKRAWHRVDLQVDNESVVP